MTTFAQWYWAFTFTVAPMFDLACWVAIPAWLALRGYRKRRSGERAA